VTSYIQNKYVFLFSYKINIIVTLFHPYTLSTTCEMRTKFDNFSVFCDKISWAKDS